MIPIVAVEVYLDISAKPDSIEEQFCITEIGARFQIPPSRGGNHQALSVHI
jgi:hypothetical protein